MHTRALPEVTRTQTGQVGNVHGGIKHRFCTTPGLTSSVSVWDAFGALETMHRWSSAAPLMSGGCALIVSGAGAPFGLSGACLWAPDESNLGTY